MESASCSFAQITEFNLLTQLEDTVRVPPLKELVSAQSERPHLSQRSYLMGPPSPAQPCLHRSSSFETTGDCLTKILGWWLHGEVQKLIQTIWSSSKARLNFELFGWCQRLLKVTAALQNQCHADKAKISLIPAQSCVVLQRLSLIILLSCSQNVKMWCQSSGLSLYLAYFYYLFACFQVEVEEIWRELSQGNFQTVLMSKTSALLLSKYRLLCYNCAENVCFVGTVFSFIPRW